LAYIIIALVVFIIDRGTKWLIVKQLHIGDQVPVIGEFFQITSHRNRGAAFGILQEQRWFFIVITLVVAVAILIYLRKIIRERRRLMGIALGLLLGGAIGNFYDRALRGEVVDFLQFHFNFTIFGYHVDYIFPIFNVADSAICIGVALILLDTVLDWRKEKKASVQEQESENHGS
jgi:signal peptidase II